MDNSRQAQQDPLLHLTHGAVALSPNRQYPTGIDNSDIQGQPDFTFKETDAALLPFNGSPTHSGRLEPRSKDLAQATNGAPRGTGFRDVNKDMDNGMLESQVHPRLDTTHRPPEEAEDHASERRGKLQKSAFRNTLENFSPIWFVLTMNTGILGILMRLLPYQFNGLSVLSTIMYLFNLVLFVIICTMTILRWTLYPKVAQQKTAVSIDEISFHAAAPIGFQTLTSLTGIIVSNAYWGGHAWSLVAYVMWWFGMIWILTMCIGVCITLFRLNHVDDRSMTPSLFLTAVGLATTALVGAQVVTFAYDISPRLAVPVIIVAYLLAGLAIWLSIILYGIFFHRLMASGWPEPAKRPSLMLLVGPFGQTSAALQALGAAALTKKDFAGYQKGVFLQASAASSVSSASTVFALLLLGHDIFWLICCLFGILEGVYRRQFKGYTLTWWSTIFPIATMAVSFLQLSISMDSPTFRVLTAALLLILLVDYFVNWGFTLFLIVTSDLLFKKADKDMPDEEKQD